MYFIVSEIKQSPSTSKTEYGQSTNINTGESLDRKTSDFPNLNTLCQSYSEYKNVNNLTPNSSDECTISGILIFSDFSYQCFNNCMILRTVIKNR